ncbi:hypothetical protein EI94DRAFT_1813913 [Lactarius quietus]|nr:hypothetical protein EI94DRAFT_1813913 [Lactarius quietus]
MSLTQNLLALGSVLHRLLRGAGARSQQCCWSGRALLWSEMRGLRTSMERLRLGDAALAEGGKELEGNAMSAEAPEDSERQL